MQILDPKEKKKKGCRYCYISSKSWQKIMICEHLINVSIWFCGACLPQTSSVECAA
jgi:hypothetical protein